MLTSIYGTEGAAGVSKLISEPRADIRGALRFAAGPGGMAAERAEEATSRKTMERIKAKTDAEVLEVQLDVTEKENYNEELRRLADAKQKQRERRHPVKEWGRQFLIIGKEREKEELLFMEWAKSLTPEEKKQILEQEGYKPGYFPEEYLYKRWKSMPPQEQYETITGSGREQPVGAMGATVIHYHNDINYFPFSGTAADREIGTIAGGELKF